MCVRNHTRVGSYSAVAPVVASVVLINVHTRHTGFDRALRALVKHERAPTTHDSILTPPVLASRGPPPSPSLLTIARLSPRGAISLLGGRRSRGRNYHISRRTRHELQAHHVHVALLTSF